MYLSVKVSDYAPQIREVKKTKSEPLTSTGVACQTCDPVKTVFVVNILPATGDGNIDSVNSKQSGMFGSDTEGTLCHLSDAC